MSQIKTENYLLICIYTHSYSLILSFFLLPPLFFLSPFFLSSLFFFILPSFSFPLFLHSLLSPLPFNSPTHSLTNSTNKILVIKLDSYNKLFLTVVAPYWNRYLLFSPSVCHLKRRRLYSSPKWIYNDNLIVAEFSSRFIFYFLFFKKNNKTGRIGL